MTNREWNAVGDWAVSTLALAASAFLVVLAIGAAARLAVPGIARALAAADAQIAQSK